MPESESLIGRVHSVETMGALDGPGLRYVIFLQGCPLRCAYCHNPDTWAIDAGYEISAQAQTEEILRYRNYLTGGVTISGGEPLTQPEFVLELIQRCRSFQIHSAIDTSGAVPLSACKEAVREADLLLLDIKAFDDEKAKKLCGIDMNCVRQILDFRQEIGKPVWIRHVLVPGITLVDTDEDGNGFADAEKFFHANTELSDGIARCKDYSCVEKIELLPFHKLGVDKWEKLSIPFTLNHIDEPLENVIAWSRSLI
jgi:pyruvate formate lyase activating enzyme